MSKPGRRPTGSDTRSAIEKAALAQFACRGFSGATTRAIAAEAGVDPGLITHFYGSKRGLFEAVLSPPAEMLGALVEAMSGPEDSLGERLAGILTMVLNNPDITERMTAVLRTAAGDPEAALAMRNNISQLVMGPLANQISASDAALRANLIGSTTAGIVMARLILGVEPIASTDAAQLRPLLAAALQAYVTA